MSKILIIDDTQDNLISISALLKNLMPGSELFTAQSGEEGIVKANKECPDTILLDIIMPGMDGYQVCQQLKASDQTRHIPIILVTALTTGAASRIKGLDLGADAFLSKPIDPAELTAQVNVMLRIKSTEDQLRQEKKALEQRVKERTMELIQKNQQLKKEIDQRHCEEEKRKKLEEQLIHSQKMESIGILAGGIAHDFNNILGVITGNISYVLSMLNPEEEPYEVLMDVQEGANQAHSLTQQLLTFSRGGMPVKKLARIEPIIKEAATFVTRGSTSVCQFDFSNDLWSIDVDQGQINQVFSNLIINANQAMPDGGTIHIKIENTVLDTDSTVPLPGGHYVKITVHDQGIGISEKHLSRIFEPYFSTKTKGSGLGLATTYAIIQKHGGHISVASNLEKGTTFHIYLPAMKTPYIV
ncbi:MAG: response regulator [Candidatus Magnetomorum sp.]|nr:response regulator [Candidatus Magnetomorum sp.]